MILNENSIIRCSSVEEVRDCLRKLEDLGFTSDINIDAPRGIFVAATENLVGQKLFTNFEKCLITKDQYILDYKKFLDLYTKELKESKSRSKDTEMVEKREEPKGSYYNISIRNKNNTQKIIGSAKLTDGDIITLDYPLGIPGPIYTVLFDPETLKRYKEWK